MAIDAIVKDVQMHSNGTATLILVPRPDGPPNSISSLIIVNPPKENFDAIIGTEIWSDPKYLWVGDKKIAERLGFIRARLLPRKGRHAK